MSWWQRKSKGQAKKQLTNYQVVDYVGVSLFFLVLAVMVFFFLRRASYVEVLVRISESDNMQVLYYNRTPDWYIEYLRPGINEKDLLGRTMIEVADVYYYPTLGANQTVFVKLKMRAVFNKNTGQYTYNGKVLLVGNHELIKLRGLAIEGIIHDISGMGGERKTEIYLAKGILETQNNEGVPYPAETSFDGIKKNIADLLEPGLEVADSKGGVVAEIVEVEISRAKREFIYGGSLVSVDDPKRRRVEMEVKLWCVVVGDKCYYREETPLRINSVVGFDFDNFGVAMTIEELVKVEE